MGVLFRTGDGEKRIKIAGNILKIAKTIYIFAVRFLTEKIQEIDKFFEILRY